MKARHRAILRTGLATALLLALNAAWAQAPDAGRLLQENVPAPPPPRPSPGLTVQPPAAGAALLPGGAQATLSAVRIEGLSVLPAEPLVQALGPVQGRRFALADLRALAEQLTQQLRDAGYPFARAYLPPQDLAGGVLRIAVVEGRYGRVESNDERARSWLAPLQPGSPITAQPLERTLLLLSDLPGLGTQPVLRPGDATGTGDLVVQVDPGRRFSGEAGLDNHGNRYAGRERINGAFNAYSLAAFGDQLALRGNVSREGTWLGGLSYSLPLGSGGWRAQLAASRTDYELGKEFEALGAHGTADTFAAGVSYPLLRSQAMNLRLSAALQAKRLHDQRDATGSSERKRSESVPLSLSADRIDAGGVSWGSLALTLGRLRLDTALEAADAATAQTAGGFHKFNLEAARLQSLAPGWTLYGRLSGQWAGQNLDSSEKMVLGGPTGVRAWPSGEATGDEGLLAQVELRWRGGAFEPYAFIDGGRVRLNRSPWAAGDNRRSITGAGLGVRWGQGPWLLDAAAAWRGGDRAPATEPNAGEPQAWVSLAYRF